ncbi:hypothetical protein BD769DRAFT_1645199 [Suillus cothurnatus]|nr:hypothetical protein BD769DRAFT_1645199 [Suillus cothurnatus]
MWSGRRGHSVLTQVPLEWRCTLQPGSEIDCVLLKGRGRGQKGSRRGCYHQDALLVTHATPTNARSIALTEANPGVTVSYIFDLQLTRNYCGGVLTPGPRVGNVDVGDSQWGIIPAISTYLFHFYSILTMVNWNDPDLEVKLEVLSVQLLYAILGLYGWEYIRSSHVEIALIRRQLPFRWPLVRILEKGVDTCHFYTCPDLVHFRQIRLLDYDHLTILIFVDKVYLVLGMNFAIMFSTNIAIGCSTTNLMIRTWLIWKTNFLLRLLLVLLSLGHWALLTLFLATARASVINGVCTIYLVNVAYASAGIIYGILYDLVLLVFTIIGLLRMPSSSTLWKTLIKQGVIYFILNLVANVIILVLDRLNLNPIMNGIFATPAACICTIASSQVVLFLLRPSSNHESDSTSSVKVPPLTSDFVVTVPCSAGNCEQIDVVRRCVNK